MKKEKCFVSFSYHDRYAMIEREKSFCHLATMFTNEEGKTFFLFYLLTTTTTPWSREKKVFFHSATLSTNEERKMMFFIYSLRSLCHDQEWILFCHLPTTITTLWSREKKVFFWFYLLRSLRHDQERKIFFHLATILANEKGKMFFSFSY